MRVLSSLAGLNSDFFFGLALQNGKQLFLTGFHKSTNTSFQGSVSILMTAAFVHKKEFLFLNSLKDFWISLAEIS
jgi:hypothetical protein